MRQSSDTLPKRVAARYLESFNKFNAPEVMAQLLKALEVAGLEDTVEDLRRLHVPQLVDKAWKNKGRVAASKEPRTNNSLQRDAIKALQETRSLLKHLQLLSKEAEQAFGEAETRYNAKKKSFRTREDFEDFQDSREGQQWWDYWAQAERFYQNFYKGHSKILPLVEKAEWMLEEAVKK